MLLLLVFATLSQLSRMSKSDPFCVVKWRGVELGRTKTCPNTLEPDWGEERFRLTLPDDLTDTITPPLIIEVWDEDALTTKGDFLGQVRYRCTTATSVLLRLVTRSGLRLERAVRGGDARKCKVQAFHQLVLRVDQTKN